MKYVVEEELSRFNFWSGGADWAAEFSDEQLDLIGEELDRLNADRGELMTDSEINDLFWFEPDYVASLIGLHFSQDTGKLIEDCEEWVRDCVTEDYEWAIEIYFDDFFSEYESEVRDYTSKNEVIRAFETYLNDNYEPHAIQVCEEGFPDLGEDFVENMIADIWEPTDSDEVNLEACETYIKENSNE